MHNEYYVVDGISSSSVPVISGVPPGDSAELPYVSLIRTYINKNITSSKLGLFADDSVVYKTIYNKDDSITLHKDLSTLSDWAKIWQIIMNFNIRTVAR